MQASPLARALPEFLVGVGAVAGVLFVGWGVWLLYAGLVNFDPRSELPRWLLFALAVPVLALGLSLLVLARSLIRKQRKSVRA